MAAFISQGIFFICGSEKPATQRSPIACAVAAGQPNTPKSGIVTVTAVR